MPLPLCGGEGQIGFGSGGMLPGTTSLSTLNVSGFYLVPPAFFSSDRNARLNGDTLANACVDYIGRERLRTFRRRSGVRNLPGRKSRSSATSRKILSPGSEFRDECRWNYIIVMTWSRVRIPPGPQLWTRSSADRAGRFTNPCRHGLSLWDAYRNVEVRRHGIP
jgi:hypothetical protein